MRYTIRIFAIAFSFILFSCKKKATETAVPPCIESKINEFKTYACPNGAFVNAYRFQNKTVYSFNLGKCGADLSTNVYDASCNNLGFLGGISGNTKINGEEFSTAVFIRTIWQR